jgi:SSS family solute:Na+ symporter
VLGLKGQGASFVAAGAAFVVDILVSLLVSTVTAPKPESELRGLVYSLTPRKDFHDPDEGRLAWYQKPTRLAGIGAVLVIILNILFW